MIVKEFDYLPEDSKRIREEVFIKEQGFQEEFDEIDHIAKHLVIYEGDKPISTCRIYFHQSQQSYVIGRVAVIKEWRGKNIGCMILNSAESIISKEGGDYVMLSGQFRIKNFYEKLGYKKYGEVYLDEGCPHIWMIKNLVVKDETHNDFNNCNSANK